MADFNEYSQKGSTLMQQALKKLVDGDIESFEKDRQEANKYFDMFYQSVNSEEGKITQMYGESRNFGVIYNVFEQNIDKLYENKSKKRIIKEMYYLIKNNKILNEQFKIYDMFEKTTDVDNVKDFVTESTNLIKHYSKQQIKENNEKVIRLIKKNKLDEFVEIPEETENLYEAIEYVILNKKSLDNVNNFIKAQNIITEHIENNKKLINEDKEPISFEDFQKELNKEEENLIENINNDEKKLLDMFTNPNANRKQVFENYKSNTLKKIKGAIQIAEENDKQQWEKIYEQINAKTYSDKLSDNIINCAEMSEICSTIEE
jgi:hypothetical protein